MRLLISIVVFLWTLSGFAQLDLERIAQNRLQKQKWAKSRKALDKAISRNRTNPEAKFVYSTWYFAAANPSYNIDSAFTYCNASLSDYASSSPKQKERIARFPLDSLILLTQLRSIDTAAFERAKDINSERSYMYYLENLHPGFHRTQAVELRNEVAYLDALKSNTWQSFSDYLEKYPDSHRAGEAKQRYERLLYETKTRDGSLKSYVEFYNTYSSSPYISSAERHILELSTKSGSRDDYLKFIESYPRSTWAKRARDILFHLIRQSGGEIPESVKSDSLASMIALGEKYWVPILRGQQFGFINEDGEEVVKPQFEAINTADVCGAIDDDYLIVSDGIIARNGNLILKGDVVTVEDIGFGFLIVQTKGSLNLVHKSGWDVLDVSIQDAMVIANRFLAIKKDNWSLYTFTGLRLTEFRYDSVETADGIIVLSRNGKKSLHTWTEIVALGQAERLQEKLVFDDSRKMGEGLLLVRNGALEGVLNENLEFVIPLGRQVLTKTPYGFERQINRRYMPVGISSEIDKVEYKEVRSYSRWVGLFGDNRTQLFDLQSKRMLREDLDSLVFTNKVAIAIKGDSASVFLSSGRSLTFRRGEPVKFIGTSEAVQFFFVPDKDKKNVFQTETGDKQFTIDADQIDYFGYGAFLIGRSGRKGLVDAAGKSLLPIEYDAIVKTGSGYVSLLKDRKFGLFDMVFKRLIKPTYERNITQFSKDLLVAYKDGKYGFINWESKPVTPFEFEEVRPWSDSTAMVKINFTWKVVNPYTGETLTNRIKDYRLIKDSDDEKIAIIHIENDFGVLSSTKGIIIQATFSDIVNVGTPEKPLYFTEKHVEEAELYVVIYYDHTGKFIRRQVYEDEDYDRIYCADN